MILEGKEITMKNGIACAGHWVLDHIKRIDNLPDPSGLCNILSESIQHGGAPFNVLVTLHALKVKFPTYGIGCIGDDESGRIILEICRTHNISTEFLKILKNQKTSYTDVMTINTTGERTMFHYHGVNDLFSYEDVPLATLKKRSVKFFYLGHLLLMDRLDAARLLRDVQAAGMQTIVDTVTEKNRDRYQTLVLPCLSYVDYLVINESEAEKLSQLKIRQKNGQVKLPVLKKVAQFLLQTGGVVQQVIIHMPEGALSATQQGYFCWKPSFQIPSHLSVSACGAGDAFCSGVLVGLHEGWNEERTLSFAHAVAALAMTSMNSHLGLRSIEETLKTVAEWPLML
jgi:sugar/nucleoside kinase (ribokinase family)